MLPQLSRLGRRSRILVAAAAVLVLVTIAFIIRLGTQLAAMRTHRATGPSWSFPSRIYSDGVSLVVGRTMSEEYLVAELIARDYRRVPGPATEPGTYARTPGNFEIVLRGLPDEPDPAGSGGPERVELRIVRGRLVSVERGGSLPSSPRADVTRPPRLEPVLVSMLFDKDRIWRTWVSLERIPEPMRDAVIAAEDRRFYRHIGVDLRANFRALRVNLRSGSVREGGSTITQQLARGLFLGRERTMGRKLIEIPLALGIELMLSKDQILEMYLNSVYWGQARGYGVGGVAEAGRLYFNAPVESLDVLQAATLAAMIPAPNTFNPFVRPKLVRERRDLVLEDMVETRRLSRHEMEELRRQPLRLQRGSAPTEAFPSYSGLVREVVDDEISRNAATRHGLSIFTAMDLAWQQQAEAGLAAGLGALDGGGRRRDRLEGAFVALEPATSAVRVLVGGRSPKAGDFNRAFQARRQSGSAIKPIVYAAALQSTHGFTPATTVPNTLRTFGEGDDAWTPHNVDGIYQERVTLAKALEKSMNVATANLVEMVGPGEVVRVAEHFGLGRLKPVMSIGLGSNEVTPLSLTNAFTAFGNRGMLRQASPIRSVVNRAGRLVLESPARAEQAIPEGIAALMTGLLQNVVRYGVGYPLVANYGFYWPVAGKTGTTDDFRDAWFIGFTTDVIAGVWVGYDQPRSIGRPAVATALPIWARIVSQMLRGFPPTAFTDDSQLDWRDIDPWSGFLADTACPRVEKVPFLPGTAPTAFCQHANLFPDEYRGLDSLSVQDSTGTEEPLPDSLAVPDTVEVPPQEP